MLSENYVRLHYIMPFFAFPGGELRAGDGFAALFKRLVKVGQTEGTVSSL
jgi:hypothetical protein